MPMKKYREVANVQWDYSSLKYDQEQHSDNISPTPNSLNFTLGNVRVKAAAGKCSMKQ